jgi:hypothetical protein
MYGEKGLLPTHDHTHTHCQAAQASHTSQSLSISVSEPSHGQKRKKHESTTLAIRNAGESADMKVITLNNLTAKRKVKCLEIPH